MEGKLSSFAIAFLSHRASCFVIAISALLALATPTNILSEHRLLAAFSEFCRSISPVINAYHRKSSFPEVSTLYFSVMLFVSPLVYVSARDCSIYRIAEIARLHEVNASRFWLQLLMIVAIFILAIIVFYYGNNGYEFQIFKINSSRISLALFGWMVAGGAPFMMLVEVLQFINVARKKAAP